PVDAPQVVDELHHDPLDARAPPRRQRVADVDVDEEGSWCGRGHGPQVYRAAAAREADGQATAAAAGASSGAGWQCPSSSTTRILSRFSQVISFDGSRCSLNSRNSMS